MAVGTGWDGEGVPGTLGASQRILEVGVPFGRPFVDGPQLAPKIGHESGLGGIVYFLGVNLFRNGFAADFPLPHRRLDVQLLVISGQRIAVHVLLDGRTRNGEIAVAADGTLPVQSTLVPLTRSLRLLMDRFMFGTCCWTAVRFQNRSMTLMRLLLLLLLFRLADG